MSAERTTRVVVGPDGKPRKRLRNGRTVALKGRTNWKRLAEMTEAEVTARARADRDARPVPRKRLGEFRRVSLSPNEVRSIRLRSGLTSLGLSDTRDRKSTRLNSSHLVISYAVFCLKKKN